MEAIDKHLIVLCDRDLLRQIMQIYDHDYMRPLIETYLFLMRPIRILPLCDDQICIFEDLLHILILDIWVNLIFCHFYKESLLLCLPIYSRLSLSRNRRDPLKHFEISVLQHIRFVVLRKNNLNNQISQMTM